MKFGINRICRLLLVGMLTAGQLGYAAETGLVAEVFACTWTEDGDMAGVDQSTEFFKQQIAAMNNPAVSAIEAYLWTPFRASTEFDVLWFSVHANLTAFGAAADAMNSPEGETVFARYAEDTDCSSSLMEMTEIYASETLELTEPAVVEAFRCTLHDGKTMADVQTTLDEWRGVLGQLGGYDNYIAFMMTPMVSSTPYDVYYFGVHDNAAAYAARTTNMRTSDAGQMMNQKFGELQRCEATTWYSRQVLEGSG